jgi:hypothetical protein
MYVWSNYGCVVQEVSITAWGATRFFMSRRRLATNSLDCTTFGIAAS